MRGDGDAIQPLTIDDVSRIHFRGGSVLGTSRANPTKDPAGMQCLTYGISFWLPYHGTGNVACGNVGYYAPDSDVTATPVEPWRSITISLSASAGSGPHSTTARG